MKNGTTLKVATLAMQSFIERVKQFAKNPDEYVERIKAGYSFKVNAIGRLMLSLITYLEQHTENFDRTDFVLCSDFVDIYPNGSLGGTLRILNHSEADIGVNPKRIDEYNKEVVDFSYPYLLVSYTFVTSKPKYEPQMFGIFQTFSSMVWISILSAFIAMLLLSYVIFRKKHNCNQVFLHVLAVLLRQGSLIVPSSFVENLIVYSWIIGAMFLCLAYDSVFLSFLSFPPATKIEHVSDVANAIKNKGYHCMAAPSYGMEKIFLSSNDQDLKTIALDLLNNNLSDDYVIENFESWGSQKKLVLFGDSNYFIHRFRGTYFMSDDRLHEYMPAMFIRKGFCCKNLVDNFVHKMMASGLLYKYYNDLSFLYSMPHALKNPRIDTTLRKLTLTDVAPAFFILLIGYILSFFVFIFEVSVKLKKKR